MKLSNKYEANLVKKVYSPVFMVSFSLLCLFAAAGCSGTSDRWMGSVDAVFRYRPSESSTVVYEVRAGSFSKEAGLRDQDVLLAVDGKDVTAAPFEDVRDTLRGPVGTKAVLTVKRNDEIVEITVERRPIVKREEKDKGKGRAES